MFALLLFATAAAVSFRTDFEAGNLGRVETVAPDHYRCHVLGESDQDKRNRQASWYYFRIDGARGRTLTIDLVDLAGEYNYQPTQGAIIAETPPYYSEDQKTWRPLEGEFDAAGPRMRVRVEPHANRVWIAHQPPYTTQNLAILLSEMRSNRAFSVENVGKTVHKRDIPLVTITDPATPVAGKKVIWILFRQHSWEAGSSWAGEGAIRFLLSAKPEAAAIRRATVFKIFPMCDPDGVARGGVRFNANGFDLNRNWDVRDPVRMPEIDAERGAILQWVDAGGRVDLALTLHNDEKPEYIESAPGQEHMPLAHRFYAALEQSPVFAPTKPVAPSTVSTTAGKPGRMSFHQGLYNDRKLPAFLIEQMTVSHPKLGRRPVAADRILFGEDLVKAMVEAVGAR